MRTAERYMIHSAIIFAVSLIIFIVLGIVHTQFTSVLLSINITILILLLSGFLFVSFYLYNRFYEKDL